jgi:hypothetical protein
VQQPDSDSSHHHRRHCRSHFLLNYSSIPLQWLLQQLSEPLPLVHARPPLHSKRSTKYSLLWGRPNVNAINEPNNGQNATEPSRCSTIPLHLCRLLSHQSDAPAPKKNADLPRNGVPLNRVSLTMSHHLIFHPLCILLPHHQKFKPTLPKSPKCHRNHPEPTKRSILTL